MKKETNPVAKFANAEKQTRSLAIAAKCAECVGCTENHVEPGFRASVKECTSFQCPLYNFRPYK